MTAIKKWNRLDNAAKIFPPTTSQRDPKVFRFVCELNEPVEQAILQNALDKTVDRFPFYRSVLKKGLFWYFFEESSLKPAVCEEIEPPCSPIYNADEPGLLFRVLCHKKRISLEVFHALTDGMGAVHFLRTLVYFYLTEKHPECADAKLDVCEPSLEQIRQDAFRKYYDEKKQASYGKDPRAYRVRGSLLPAGQNAVLEAVMPAGAVLKAAHEHGATLSEFLVSLLLFAIADDMTVRDRKRPVVITVPADLRHFFPTQTARNFFGVIRISHTFQTDGEDFDSVLKNVRSSFKKQLVTENMLDIINRYSALENNLAIKAVPLAVKIPCLRLAGRYFDRQETAAVSNLGIVTMPPELAPHIRLFDVMLCTKRPQICLCSFQDTLVLSYTSPLENTGLPCALFRKLTAMGVPVEISSNLEQEEEKSVESL